MADPATYRPPTGDIPTLPDVHRLSDGHGRVIYVGKAKNLRNRLTSYFQNPANLHPRTQQVVFTVTRVQWTVIRSEIEALTLEFTWIREFNPRFNVIFKDDKTYPYLAVTMGRRFPRVQVTRQTRRTDTNYYGPYTQIWAIKETIDLLSRVYPVRTCTPGVFQRVRAQGRPCLLADIEKCSAPCVGRISEEERRALAESLCEFIEGKADPIVHDLHIRMKEAAAELDYETAAHLRDDIAAIETVLEKSAVVLNDGTDADVFALAADEPDVAVYAFHVRGGRIRGTRDWVIDRVDEAGEAQLMERLLEQVYSQLPPTLPTQQRREQERPSSVDDAAHIPTSATPREILLSHMLSTPEIIAQWLSERRGSKVVVHTPKRGPETQLMAAVMENACQALEVHRTRRASDLSERAKALEEPAENPGLNTTSLRIECYDVSHTTGQDQVALMVVFEDGVPWKDAYRAYNIRGEDGQGIPNDTSAMDEVLKRRFSHLLAEEAGIRGKDEEGVAYESEPIDATTGRLRRFSYRPDLVVVDGGLPQVNAARRALDEIGVDIPPVGLAKRLEGVWIPGGEFPLILPCSSAALHLLQYLRDESHRFAITKHRQRKGKGVTRSVLDAIPDAGPARQKALLKAFGSVKRLRLTSLEEVALMPGIRLSLVSTILEALDPKHTDGH